MIGPCGWFPPDTAKDLFFPETLQGNIDPPDAHPIPIEPRQSNSITMEDVLRREIAAYDAMLAMHRCHYQQFTNDFFDSTLEH